MHRLMDEALGIYREIYEALDNREYIQIIFSSAKQ